MIKINNMSIDYYLFCRKRYNNIINNLKEIINENDLFFNETSKLEMEVAEYILEELNLIENIEHFKNKLKYFIILKDICERKIYKLCDHNFIDDYIDINLECSQKITYCTICEHTK